MEQMDAKSKFILLELVQVWFMFQITDRWTYVPGENVSFTCKTAIIRAGGRESQCRRCFNVL